MSTIPYVRRGGEVIYQQPFDAKGVDYYGFVMRADRDTLKAQFCDPLLNEPSHGALDFAPYMGWFMLVFNKIDALCSTQGPDSQKGSYSELESAIWLLLKERKSGKVYWFLPYIFVDNPYSLCMGRETYGFPKSLGSFHLPASPAQATRLGLDTMSIARFSPHSTGSVQNLWSVTRETPPRSWFGRLFDKASARATAAADAAEEVLTEDLEGFLQKLSGRFSESALTEGIGPMAARRAGLVTEVKELFNLLRSLLTTTVPMVFLKQFPDIADGSHACHQSIGTSDIKMTRFHGGRLLPRDYAATFQALDTHPVCVDTGLAPAPCTHKPMLSFYGRFDFHVKAGSTLWAAS